MKQTYLKPNTIQMNLCGEYMQTVCISLTDPSLPQAPESGTEYNFGS